MTDELNKYRSKNKLAPHNLFYISLEKLVSLGYKQRHFKGKLNYKQEPYSEENDLVCATNKDKDLWILLDKKSAKRIDPAKFLVYYK